MTRHSPPSLRPPLFISHGAPDVYLLDTPAHRAMRALGEGHPPSAYVVISAHWQSGRLEITSETNPRTIHDFRGFGPVLDAAHYDAPGDPVLAETIRDRLHDAGLEAHLNPTRGRDHGSWIPLGLIRPQADIPVLQISLPRVSDQDSISLGRALAPLAFEDIQLIGSGALTHSLADSLSAPEQAPPYAFAKAFRDALLPAIQSGDPVALAGWETAPHAIRNHPTPEHFRPLLVAMAAGGGGEADCLHHSWSRGALAMDIWRFTPPSP